MILKDIISELRPNQWYKNLVIFLAIIFSKNLFSLEYLSVTFLGLFCLIMVSSSNYILNDIIDIKKDRLNSEKKNRPIASGRISTGFGIFIMLILLAGSFYLSYQLDFMFFLIVVSIFLGSALYSTVLKNIVFADILAIASLFVLRSISGAFVIDVYISNWLVIGVFFFALFLVTGKRYGELCFLKSKAQNHRAVLKQYNAEITKSLFNIFMSMLMIIFALFSFSSENPKLIWTIPFFIFVILRYYYLIMSGSSIIRSPEKAISDMPLLIGSLIFIFAVIMLLFAPMLWENIFTSFSSL